MLRTLTATEVKTRILSLLDEVAAGDEVVITKHGRPVARLVPPPGAHRLRGLVTGVAVTAAPDEDLFSTSSSWDLG